ncbi:MAG: hypothetical protein KF855_00690 [Acidobacteria bacterium]|nr:hypothetical protein [Acidobacteriota bacterium]
MTTLRRCCFLSMDDLTGYVADDDLAIEPLRALGWEVSTVSWRDTNADWNDFDVVVIRTTWDYHYAPDEFLNVLEKIDASPARLENALTTVRWNLDKTYLRDLEEKGINIVPTVWANGAFSADDLEKWKTGLNADELIVKPTVSATARDTFRIRSFDAAVSNVFNGRNFMIQPFMRSVVEEGEFSLFYFNGEYSHTILKRPKTDDFRVQEDHGGIISEAEPETAMLTAAQQINDTIEPLPLYSRIDLVRHNGDFALMELELIEPALYFRMNDRSPVLFAEQFDRRMR